MDKRLAQIFNKPTSKKTNEELSRDNEELQKMLGEVEKHRLSLGLPAKRPAKFVTALHAKAMVERVKLVQEVLTSYLRFINDGKQLVPFPAETFADHLDLLTLIDWEEGGCLSMYSGLLRMSIDVIKDEENTYEKVVTKLYYNLGMAQQWIELADESFSVRSATKFDGTPEELDEIIADYQRHYDEVVAPQLAHEAEVFAKYEAEQAKNGGGSD